jgi:O-antigen ligase
MSVYINQAHNDWVQLIIEGGVVVALILLSLLVWMARAIVAISLSRAARVRGIFWIGVFAIISAASMIDYPLRTPLFQVVAIWFLLALSRDRRDMNAT